MYSSEQDMAWSIFKLLVPYPNMKKVKEHIEHDFASCGIDKEIMLKIADIIEKYWEDSDESI